MFPSHEGVANPVAPARIRVSAEVSLLAPHFAMAAVAAAGVIVAAVVGVVLVVVVAAPRVTEP